VSAPPPLPVSVIVPAYNREALLERALASVAAQRGARPAEIVVVDDASTDDTAAVAERLGARVVRHDANRGAAAARNTGIAAATQPWLAMLDSDDEWLPHHLATLWELRDGHDLVAGASIAVGGGGPPRYHGPLARRARRLRSPAALYPENFIPASGVLVRRAAVLAAGGYRTDLRYAEDLDLWIRIVDRGGAVVTPRVVTRYGRHEGQKSQVGDATRAVQLRIVESYRHAAWWSPALVERQLAFRAWDAACAALRTGDRTGALRELRWFVARPKRLAALARLLTRRWRSRRRSLTLTATGAPSVALLPGAPDPDALRAAGLLDSEPVDLRRARGTAGALVALLRRPVGVAIVKGRGQELGLRSVGIDARRVDARQLSRPVRGEPPADAGRPPNPFPRA
jgi:glycosyltransferase involved in cell wall biosynthesis